MTHLHTPNLQPTTLKSALESHEADVTFKLIPNPYADRSGADPTIVAAVIGAGGAVLSALIALFGIIYIEHKKDKRASAEKRDLEDLKLMVKTQHQRIDALVSRVGEAQARQLTETDAGEDVFDHLVLDLETATTATDPSNPYHDLLQDLDPTRVTDLVILED